MRGTTTVGRWLAWGILVLALHGCGGGSDVPPPPRTTTLMVYMVGSDLESGRGAEKGTAAVEADATNNIREMLGASTAHVNVVLTTGGALKDDPANLGLVRTWKTLKRHLIHDGKIDELADLGPQNMGDPATLAGFIEWAKSAYPADRYVLAFWDHGAGYYGFGTDENFNNKMLSVPEMTSALKTAERDSGMKLDFVGYDACLMATTEVAAALAPYAHYLGASQELEPGSGWDWKTVINTLSANPGIDTLQFGRVLADSYIAKQTREGDALRSKYGAAYAEDGYNTFSIVDLTQMSAVDDALAQLGTGLTPQIAGSDGWVQVAQARAHAMSFGGNANKDSDSYDLVDISQFASRLRQAGIATAQADALQLAVSGAVAYRKTGDLVAGMAHGLSVYFPARSIGSYASYTLTNTYQALAMPADYKNFLQGYVSRAGQLSPSISIDPPTIAANVLQAHVSSTLGTKEVHALLSDASGASAGKIAVLGVMPADLNAQYGSATLDLGKGWIKLNGHPFPIIESEPEMDDDGDTVGYRHVIPILRNGVPSSLEVRQTGLDAANWSVIGVWDGIDTGHAAARSGEPFLPTDDITLLQLDIDTATGAVEYTPQAQATFKAGSMQFERSVLAPGSYTLRYAVTDYRENDNVSGPVPYNL